MNEFDEKTFIKDLDLVLRNKIKLAMNIIRILLSSLRKSKLKTVGILINDYLTRQ